MTIFDCLWGLGTPGTPLLQIIVWVCWVKSMNYLLGQKVVFNRDSKEHQGGGGRFSINFWTQKLSFIFMHPQPTSLSGVYACFYFASLRLVITATIYPLVIRDTVISLSVVRLFCFKGKLSPVLHAKLAHSCEQGTLPGLPVNQGPPIIPVLQGSGPQSLQPPPEPVTQGGFKMQGEAF